MVLLCEGPMWIPNPSPTNTITFYYFTVKSSKSSTYLEVEVPPYVSHNLAVMGCSSRGGAEESQIQQQLRRRVDDDDACSRRGRYAPWTA